MAFTVFVALFCGGLAVFTLGMLWIWAKLLRRNREERAGRRGHSPSRRG